MLQTSARSSVARCALAFVLAPLATAQSGLQGESHVPSAAGGGHASLGASLCFAEQSKLVPGGTLYFGTAVAVAGDTALVGAPSQGPGRVFVYTRSGATWSLQQVLQHDDPVDTHEFGAAVALHGDTAVIGNHRDNTLGSSCGAAYVFVRSGTSWTQQAKLLASDGAFGHIFGFCVSVSGDTAVIGAHGSDQAGASSGAAYVFVRAGSTWSEQAKLSGADTTTGNQFGSAVSLSGDTTVIGARADNDNGNSSGSAYVFVRAGTSWSQQAKLLANNGAVGDNFGDAVSISGDTAVVGAHYDDDDGTDSGSAYVFVRAGTSWSQQAWLRASHGSFEDLFGEAVSISGDAIVVGAPRDDPPTNSGSVYLYFRQGASWIQQARLRASDGTSFDRLGASVAIDGETAFAGAIEDDEAGFHAGSAYVFAAPTPVGSAYCMCPVGICGNSDADAGCANSAGQGARLSARGTTLPDDVNLIVSDARPGQFGIFFEGDTAVAFPMGDGIRCAGGTLIRITRAPMQVEPDGSVIYGPCVGDAPISSVTGVLPGSGLTRRYQFWYRDPGGPCSAGFNLSHGYEIVW